MSSPFQKKFCGKTPDPIKMLGDLNKDGKMSSYEQTRQDAIEANSPNNYGSPLEQEAVDLGVVKSNYKGKVKKLPFPGKEMYEGTGDYGRYKGRYTKDMLDMNANYNYQYNKANDPSYVDRKKKQLEFEKNNPNFEDN